MVVFFLYLYLSWCGKPKPPFRPKGKMISLEVNDAVVLEQQQVFEAALSTNPKTQKALQTLIRKVIMEARAKVSSAASDKMKHDPRGAAQAVRTSVL